VSFEAGVSGSDHFNPLYWFATPIDFADPRRLNPRFEAPQLIGFTRFHVAPISGADQQRRREMVADTFGFPGEPTTDGCGM